MEYNARRRPCRDGLNCRFLKNGWKCKFDHPQEHRDIIQRESNHIQRNGSRIIATQHIQGFGDNTRQQYPNDPTAYGFNEGSTRNSTHHTHNRPSNNHPSRNYQPDRFRNDRRPYDNNTRNQRPRQTNNPDNGRSRNQDSINPHTRNRPQYHDQSPEYTYPRRKLIKEHRLSPQQNARQNGKKDKENHRNRGNHPEVKPQKNEIKMNFNHQRVQKIQEEQQSSNDFNYQPSEQHKHKLPGLFKEQEKGFDIRPVLQASRQSQNRAAQTRIALTRDQQRRRRHQLRELRLRPNQARYFYNNQRLMEENRRMIEENRIEQEDRQRLHRDFPSTEEVFGPGESSATRRHGNRRQYTFELQYDPFVADDDYGVDEGDHGFYDNEIVIEDENQVTEENFHWFVRHCKFIDGRNLTLQQAKYFKSCCICLEEFSDLLSQSAKNKDENDYMLLQLYCHEKHVYHKSCGLDWLKKKLSDQDNVAHHSYCPQCKHDFRDHEAFAEHDPNYRARFIRIPQVDNEVQQDEQELDYVNWQQELRRLFNRGRDPFLRNQRMRNVIEMVEQREREQAQRQARRRERRRLRLQREREQMENQSEMVESSIQSESNARQEDQVHGRQLHYSSSMDSNYNPLEEYCLYPRDNESNIAQQPQQNQEAQNINPQKDKQYWDKVWAEQEQSNPFSQVHQ